MHELHYSVLRKRQIFVESIYRFRNKLAENNHEERYTKKECFKHMKNTSSEQPLTFEIYSRCCSQPFQKMQESGKSRGKGNDFSRIFGLNHVIKI